MGVGGAPVTPVDKSGNVIGGAASPTVISGSQTEDAASADGSAGVAMLGVRQDTPANTSGTDGDYEFLKMSGGKLATSAYLAPLTSGTDRSGSITTGGTAQALAAANTARTGLVGQNISAGDLWINEIGGTAAVDTAGSYKITSGSPFSVSTSRAVNIIGATTGQKFTATEY